MTIFNTFFGSKFVVRGVFFGKRGLDIDADTTFKNVEKGLVFILGYIWQALKHESTKTAPLLLTVGDRIPSHLFEPSSTLSKLFDASTMTSVGHEVFPPAARGAGDDWLREQEASGALNQTRTSMCSPLP